MKCGYQTKSTGGVTEETWEKMASGTINTSTLYKGPETPFATERATENHQSHLVSSMSAAIYKIHPVNHI